LPHQIDAVTIICCDLRAFLLLADDPPGAGKTIYGAGLFAEELGTVGRSSVYW